MAGRMEDARFVEINSRVVFEIIQGLHGSTVFPSSYVQLVHDRYLSCAVELLLGHGWEGHNGEDVLVVVAKHGMSNHCANDEIHQSTHGAINSVM